jgi:hypothetical protein
MATYDPKVIEKFADKLYGRAKSAVAVSAVIGALIGGYLGYTVVASPTWALVGAAIAGAIGFAIGMERAFALRLQAQVALCQVRIAQNTEPARPQSGSIRM